MKKALYKYLSLIKQALVFIKTLISEILQCNFKTAFNTAGDVSFKKVYLIKSSDVFHNILTKIDSDAQEIKNNIDEFIKSKEENKNAALQNSTEILKDISNLCGGLRESITNLSKCTTDLTKKTENKKSSEIVADNSRIEQPKSSQDPNKSGHSI